MDKIIPYIVVDGIPTMPDSFLAGLYNNLVGDGIEKLAFSDGSVRCADDFVRLFKSGSQLLFVLTRDESPLVVGWINTFEGKRAQIHFSVFKRGIGRDHIALGKKMIGHCFSLQINGEFLFDVFYGITPTSNKLACRYAKKIMTVAATIPNFCYNFWDKTSSDGLVTYISRVQE
ncbi:MAG: hypothetical protein WC047_00520 [Kiritimatiellales bacterium]